MTVLRRFQSIKPVILSLAIVLGFVLHCPAAKAAETETAVLAGGCFWCVEADFEKLPGVTDAVSGYTGGTVADPTYRQVSRGGTGHSEAVQIIFDPDVITYRQILDLFLRILKTQLKKLDLKGKTFFINIQLGIARSFCRRIRLKAFGTNAENTFEFRDIYHTPVILI